MTNKRFCYILSKRKNGELIEMPAISVIVPVYNVERYLPRCLDSLINQTLKDIEIICINDGSPDNSLEILEEYAKKDSRIKVINQENAGLSAARNNGMSAASGEYIGFVDSDDWIDLDFYEKLYTAAKKYDADITAGCIKTWRKHNRNGVMLKYEKEECSEDLNRKFYLSDFPETCNVWNRIYKTSELKKHHLEFEVGVYYEDVCFTVEALYCMKKLAVVPETYYNYERANVNSIVKSNNEKMKQDSKHVWNRMIEFLKSRSLNLPAHYHKEKKYKLFGLTVAKIRYRSFCRECKLFNLITLNLPPLK